MPLGFVNRKAQRVWPCAS